MNDQEILEFLIRLKAALLRPDGSYGVVITKETTRSGNIDADDDCDFEEE